MWDLVLPINILLTLINHAMKMFLHKSNLFFSYHWPLQIQLSLFSEITRKIFLRNIAHISKWNLNIKKLRFQTVCCDFLLLYLEITKMAFLTYGCIWIYLSLDIFIHNSEIFYIILRYSTYTPPNTEYTFSKTTRHI